MEYISVKNAAANFNLSERRIQKLCETQRIDGCRMVSGVWLIPADAQKPMDERLTDLSEQEDCVSLRELCRELSISTATGRNWIKLGKLETKYTEKGTPYFTRDYISTLKNDIQSGKNAALKSRRNKKYISGTTLYQAYVSEDCQNIPVLQKMLDIITDEKIVLTHDITQYIIADCSLHLFTQKMSMKEEEKTSLLLKYLNGKLDLGTYNVLIDALIEDRDAAVLFCRKNPMLFSFEYLYEANEDILGLLYISCKNIGSRKATGSYYTPTKIVKKLISGLNIESAHKILDPCCGTGNFLLQLPEHVGFENIYGNDIDPVSVKITRLNMALKYPAADVKDICEHITELDYLTEYHDNKFHCIIGNPPWGYHFSDNEKEKLKILYKTAAGKNIESYDVFVERALAGLSPGGQLSYVLPEAVLNVKAHTTIRNIIMETSSIKYLAFLGNAFDGVQCPCIILHLAHTETSFSTVGMIVDNGRHSFKINMERSVSPDCFSFTAADPEYRILEKLKKTENISFLAGNADFALGIVTGNNKEYISSHKTAENEMVLKGSDINKYHINPTDNYIRFQPENFQQVAPVNMYRAPEKLLYRFICSQLVFAYDDRQTLSLNSCNIVIPKLEGTEIKYVLAILNSRIAQFIYKKEFNSVKVLRSHIENIPIPAADTKTQDEMISIVDHLIQGQDRACATELYDKLDTMIFELFHLSAKEQQTIKDAVDSDNKFLV